MRILYNELKLFIPGLKVTPKAVAECLTLTGLLVDHFEETTIGGKKDWVIGVEVRASNRPDCLGVAGIAREVAAYFGLQFVLPKFKLAKAEKKLSVNVKAAADCKRVSVVQVDNLNNNHATPLWLVETIQAHGMNSLSLLVDISNYAMLLTGYPNHIFDAGKVVGGLQWERAPKPDTFTTLDGTTLELRKGKELVVSDNLGPLVLASAVGGRRSAISERTTSVLAEVAVYHGVKVRTDARSLGVTTEASNRLEKDLAPDMSFWALEFLTHALTAYGSGVVASQIFDYYPKSEQTKLKKVVMEADFPSRLAGIPITHTEIERFLKRLGFEVTKTGNKYSVIPPKWRLDIVNAADVAEEVIRIKGFNTITPSAPLLKPVQNVTPTRILLASTFRRMLAELGFDETLTLPTITSEGNGQMSVGDQTEIRTQNAINEEFPVLRQGLAYGLIKQQHEYLKKEIYYISLFEIGKVFGRNGKRIVETDKLGILLQRETYEHAVQVTQAILEQLLRSLGAVRISYEPLSKAPRYANPHAAWLILIGNTTVGTLYQLQSLPLTGNKLSGPTAFCELDIELVAEQLQVEHPRQARELIGKLVVLDTNIEATNKIELEAILHKAQKEIGRQQLWSLDVVDMYALSAKSKVRYTVRVSYQGLTDAEAKALHEKTFGLPKALESVSSEIPNDQSFTSKEK